MAVHIDLGDLLKPDPLLFLLIIACVKVHTAFTYWCKHLPIQGNRLVVLQPVIVFDIFPLLMMFLDHIVVGVVPGQKVVDDLVVREFREFSLRTILGHLLFSYRSASQGLKHLIGVSPVLLLCHDSSSSLLFLFF